MRSYKKKCLSESELGAYIEGRLLPDKKESIDNHLVECNNCWEDFVSVNRAVIQQLPVIDDVPEHLIRKVVERYPEKHSLFDIVIGFAGDVLKIDHFSAGFNMLSSLPAAAVRGSRNVPPGMVILKKSFEDMNVELDIEKVGANLCNIKVMIDDVKSEVLMNTLRVELVTGERELVSNLIEDGETILEDIASGKYTIKIHKNGKTLGEIALKIK